MEADGQETTAAGDDEGKPRAESPLGAILRRARQRRRLSLEQVAEATGKSLHSLLGWEAGITVPRLDSLATLAGVIGLDLGDLAGAVSPPAPERRRFHRFGELFQAARQRARLTVAGVAKPVGVSPSAVMAWEEGRRLPQPQWLPRLARRLGLNLGEVDDVLGAAASPELPEREEEAEDQERTPPRAVTAALGTLLRSRRERRGLTRADLAKQTGIRGDRAGPGDRSRAPRHRCAGAGKANRDQARPHHSLGTGRRPEGELLRPGRRGARARAR